jgi:hypothetical protein
MQNQISMQAPALDEIEGKRHPPSVHRRGMGTMVGGAARRCLGAEEKHAEGNRLAHLRGLARQQQIAGDDEQQQQQQIAGTSSKHSKQWKGAGKKCERKGWGHVGGCERPLPLKKAIELS